MPTHNHPRPPLPARRHPVHPADLVPGRRVILRGVGPAEFVGRGDGPADGPDGPRGPASLYWFALGPPAEGLARLVGVADDEFDDVYESVATIPMTPTGRLAG